MHITVILYFIYNVMLNLMVHLVVLYDSNDVYRINVTTLCVPDPHSDNWTAPPLLLEVHTAVHRLGRLPQHLEGHPQWHRAQHPRSTLLHGTPQQRRLSCEAGFIDIYPNNTIYSHIQFLTNGVAIGIVLGRPHFSTNFPPEANLRYAFKLSHGPW